MKYHHSAFIYLALKKGTLIAKNIAKYNIKRIKQNQRPWNNLRLFPSTKCCHEKKYNSMQKRKAK